MNPYHRFTDEQLAEWHQHVTTIDRLNAAVANLKRQLTESTDERDRLLNAAASAAVDAQHDAATERRRHGETKQVLHRVNAAQICTLRALKALRDLVMEGKVSCDSIEWPGEVFRALQDADEVLALNDIPF